MAKSPEEMLASMAANLATTTGKPLEAWLALVAKADLSKGGTPKHGEVMAFLKSKHGVGHAYANLIARKALEAAAGGPASGAELVAAQYAGPRAGLKPIHDALIAAAKKFGGDVDIAPKKTGVSLRRAKQFALIQPATNSRIDLGLQLKGVAIAGRLEKWPNPMCSHRVRLESPSQVDRELVAWMKRAYDACG